MEPFRYVRVQDNQTAIRAAGLNDAKFIAGGTNMLDLMKLNITSPKQVVDINPLALYKIEELQNGGLRIGALVKTAIWLIMLRSSKTTRFYRKPYFQVLHRN